MLRVEQSEKGYRLVGAIDENTDSSSLPDDPSELDWTGVDRINSMGLLVWQRWRRRQSRPVTLANLPVAFVMALSWMSGLAEGMRVRSVRAPFADPETGDTEDIVLDAATLRSIRSTGVCPVVKSPTTARPMRLDDDAKQYFAFLTAAGAPMLEGDA